MLAASSASVKMSHLLNREQDNVVVIRSYSLKFAVQTLQQATRRDEQNQRFPRHEQSRDEASAPGAHNVPAFTKPWIMRLSEGRLYHSKRRLLVFRPPFPRATVLARDVGREVHVEQSGVRSGRLT